MAFHARQIVLEVVAFIYIPAKPNDHAGLFILGHIGLNFVFVFVVLRILWELLYQATLNNF